MELPSLLESILFYRAEPVTVAELVKLVKRPIDEVEQALETLSLKLQGHGIVLIISGETVAMATHPEAHSFIEMMRREELSGPLTKQALETLSVIAYRPDASKPDIDYIRGVNSQYTIRNLLSRGLIERVADEQDKRISRFRLTTDCLQHLGIASVDQLPHTDEIHQAIAARESLKAEAN